jgi:hypothetical protein
MLTFCHYYYTNQIKEYCPNNYLSPIKTSLSIGRQTVPETLTHTLDETLFDDNTHTYHHLMDPVKKIGGGRGDGDVAWGFDFSTS